MPGDHINGARALPALPKVNPSAGQGCCLTGEPLLGAGGWKLDFMALYILGHWSSGWDQTQFKCVISACGGRVCKGHRSWIDVDMKRKAMWLFAPPDCHYNGQG